MRKAILFAPTDFIIDRSLDARKCLDRLQRRLTFERHDYNVDLDVPEVGEDVDSIAVLAGLSELVSDSGYVEMEIDSILKPQELVKKLRAALPPDFPIVVVVDDAYSDYALSSYLKAGASAVVGTSGDLFGLVISRVRSWDQVIPYINAFGSL